MNIFAKLTIGITALVATSCATAPPQSPSVNVTGQWVGEWVCDKAVDGSGVVMMKLGQSGSKVTGSAHVTGASINRSTEGLSGTVSGDQLTIASYHDLNGSLSVSGDKMTGHLL